MLYINEYSEALNFYKETVPCWLKVKIHGKKPSKKGEKRTCDYCKRTDCKNLKTKLHQHTFSKRVKDFFTLDVIDQLLMNEPHLLVDLDDKFDKENFSKDDREALYSLFKESGYKTYFQTNNGKQFLNHLNRSTCTYCNRNYTLSITSKYASAQLDHWFPKDKFPILALSFYNLIPACSSCNHMKGSTDKNKDWWRGEALSNLLHPYFAESNHKFKFDFNFDKNTKKLFVLFRDIEGNKTLKTLKFNLIEDIYQAHAQLELKDLYDLRKKYPQNYLKYLLDKLHEKEPSEAEKYRLLFNIEKNEEDYHKRPFSKFKNDIIEKLLSL
ncbi:hypothetical protein BBI01_07175 [Chryseobacterium artocarpi]|uniref:HNH domain-containing protein n=1 Tax=Chryseobacterium artocarpi TaxID=1414727 RepID=A0A1B8ZK01_9FLAO|nr:HNH endonuclease [Chryseobacterium artocarpi]OCA71932.1 hypothetical protein BBI01_07175 [Chryseobacterium artocarpi]